jgi:DNA-binding transcriptional LysR family regulator
VVPSNPVSSERFDELAVFVEMASAGSLTAAARRLGVPKSTVGRALARLQADLGASLVRRASRGHVLTEAGQQLAALAAPHVGGLRDAMLAVGGGQQEPFGTLRLTAPVDVGHVVLGPLLPVLLQRYPRLHVELELSLRMVDLVGEGFDAAVRVSGKPLASSSLVARRLATIEMHLYASPTYAARRELPRNPEALAAHDHVLFQPQQGKARLRLVSRAGTVEQEVRGRLGGNDFLFLREAIVAGAGIGPLPWFIARQAVEAGRLLRVLPAYGLRGATVYFVYPPQRPVPRKTAALHAFLADHAPALMLAPPLG